VLLPDENAAGAKNREVRVGRARQKEAELAEIFGSDRNIVEAVLLYNQLIVQYEAAQISGNPSVGSLNSQLCRKTMLKSDE
jgi:hypothetical protein